VDYYLRAESEQDLWQKLAEAGLASEHEGQRYATGIDLDVIGVIYRETGETITTSTPEMGEYSYPEMAPIPGFHANIRGELTEQQRLLLPLIEKPTTPVRVWFGD